MDQSEPTISIHADAKKIPLRWVAVGVIAALGALTAQVWNAGAQWATVQARLQSTEDAVKEIKTDIRSIRASIESAAQRAELGAPGSFIVKR